MRPYLGLLLAIKVINHVHLKFFGIYQVLVPIANGTEEMEAVIIIDVLRRAGMNVEVASVENVLQIEASRKVKIVADKFLADIQDSSFDLVVLPVSLFIYFTQLVCFLSAICLFELYKHVFLITILFQCASMLV